ncbi:hypothetical protein HHK36_028594 [Tetracentron sinense]|uniref:Uncharacterized protein n=1 Tax=Tetracentron sinense TaxID=13715 RepID=A0A835D0R1_TETSI|nr:hypothetical protein HHK36_028594 [Tetracentron sinense]
MHQKKSEVQIGKESSGVSSDFNPTPPLLPSSIHQKHLHFQSQSQSHNRNHHLHIQIPSSSSSSTPSQNFTKTQLQNDPFSPPKHLLSSPHKRPLMTHSPSSTLSHSPTLSSLHHYRHPKPSLNSSSSSSRPCPFQISPATRTAVFRFLRHLRGLRVHLRLLLLLSLPSFYFFLSNPNSSFILDFLSALAFSAALLISLNLALPRLPSIRLLLARSFPRKLSTSLASRPPPRVLWSIGSKPKPEKLVNSGSWVQVYSNGDVYEGEFHKGKCSGSGVYYYYMSGRYEGDWVDEKYDGYGVETWARGSRYRGQYRQGLRHGFGVYRFYTGDVYAGEWSNGQSHGCGVHTCEDGSRYVGEFKWGVKHGLGHYHFRYIEMGSLVSPMNNKMLSTQLEAQNINRQLDRDCGWTIVDNLVVLNQGDDVACHVVKGSSNLFKEVLMLLLFSLLVTDTGCWKVEGGMEESRGWHESYRKWVLERDSSCAWHEFSLPSWPSDSFLVPEVDDFVVCSARVLVGGVCGMWIPCLRPTKCLYFLIEFLTVTPLFIECRNGDMYAGEYFADKMHGFGVYHFGNGHRYEGAWHEGRRQGLGMYTFRNGETQAGHWQNGVLDVPSTQTTHPGSPFAVNHSKVLNAVQEARRGAEKAYDVARVDERVNKAVAAANKAANAARVAAVKAVQKRMHQNNDNIPIPYV